jgi:hypothetical protein
MEVLGTAHPTNQQWSLDRSAAPHHNLLAKSALTLVCFLAPLLAGADPLGVYANLTEKTILMSSAMPRLSDVMIADLPAENANAIARIESNLSKQGIAVVHDGPHFVRLIPENMRNLMTNVPLRGVELAISKSRPTMPAGAITILGIDLDQLLPFYASFSQRTILRPATLPRITVCLQNTCSLTREEAAYALATVLTLNGIAVVEDGERFVQIVPMTERERLTLRPPKPEPDAKLMDPNKLPSVGISDPVRSVTKLERDLKRLQKALYDFIHYKSPPDRSADRLLELYASLADKTAESSKKFDGLPIWFHVETPLSKSELLYAIETTFTLNHLAIINIDDQKIRLGLIGDPAKGSGK